jgi:phosphatidylserine/phosphatidylglycerophosphate/cardiolipin synthase-like enzyme
VTSDGLRPQLARQSGDDLSVVERSARTRTAAARWAGDQLTTQIRKHHQRRLRRIGWERGLDPPAGGWSDSATVRDGNCLEVLIDGAEALPRIADALRGARSHVHLAGWYFTPGFALERQTRPTILRNLLAELAERIDVRVLVWAGAPLPLFRPSRAQVRQMKRQLTDHTRIECALDAKERPMHCHHEKTIVVDDRLAFVGGIDLTSEAGDRYDSSDHPARVSVGWHDACARIEGPVVQDVADHFRLRWRDVTGEALPPPARPDPTGETQLQIVRTVPENIYRGLPRGDFGILESYGRALRSARRLIYIENQFLWSSEIEAILVDKLRRPPRPDFRLLIVLPAKPNSGDDDTRGMLGELIEADDNGCLLACALYARSGSLFDPIYVHAKIGIVDDAWLTLGSANLNEHSLFNDTEMNVVTHDANIAHTTRMRLWSEHLERPASEIPTDTTQAIDELWKPISEDQLRRRDASLPLTHRLVRLPNVSQRSGRALGPISSLLVDG